MTKIRVPATSANLGPGFDCLGLALSIYNTFEFEPADRTDFTGVEKRFANEDNLFLSSYREAGGKNVHLSCSFDIPVSRGLGSSATLRAAGLAGGLLVTDRKDKDLLFQKTADLEGHPDNAAPAIYGGLCASMRTENGWCTRSLPIAENWVYTVLIPDHEVSTEEARSILPDSYPRSIAASNSAKAVLLCRALADGDLDLLRVAARDQIHEPYRATLIPDFHTIKRIAQEDTVGVLLISGSGSTCLLISKQPLSTQATERIRASSATDWTIRETQLCRNGMEMEDNGLWHPIF